VLPTINLFTAVRSIVGEVWMLARFAVIGALATVTHLGTAALVLHWCTCSVLIVNFIAFVCAFQVSFFGHRYVTFRKQGRLQRFIITTALGFIINTSILSLLVVTHLADGLIAIIISTFCVPFVVYLLLRFWAFQ
jgi:putative flippase GtrA